MLVATVNVHNAYAFDIVLHVIVALLISTLCCVCWSHSTRPELFKPASPRDLWPDSRTIMR